LGIAPSLGSIFLNAILAGQLALFFENVNSICILNDSGQCTYYCLGGDCYQWTFFVTAACCLIALSLSFLLRNKKQYDSENTRLLGDD